MSLAGRSSGGGRRKVEVLLLAVCGRPKVIVAIVEVD
jgi:hypothetical protein